MYWRYSLGLSLMLGYRWPNPALCYLSPWGEHYG